MSVKQEWHGLWIRHWDCEHRKMKWRLTVWMLKMRLVVGFCGNFAKANFSSLSIRNLEVIEVRGLVSVLDSWVLIPVLLCFTAWEVFVWCEHTRDSQASLSSMWILFSDDCRRTLSVSLVSLLLLISVHFFGSTTVVFLLMLSKNRVWLWSKREVFAEGRRKKKLVVIELVIMHNSLFGMQCWCWS